MSCLELLSGSGMDVLPKFASDGSPYGEHAPIIILRLVGLEQAGNAIFLVET